MRQSLVCRRLAGVVLSSCSALALAEQPLDVDRYVEVVLRAHPGAAQSVGLERAADAETRAMRRWPDPTLAYARGRSRPTEALAGQAAATETSWSLTQTIPWPGTSSAGARAASRAADGLRVMAQSVRWELAVQARATFARLLAARTLLDVARAAEDDARSLRDLVARRADLGEARESERIRAAVEWMRQRGGLTAAEREAQAAEAALRALTLEELPSPLVVQDTARVELPPLDRDALAARLTDRSPRLRLAQAEAERRQALSSAARRARVADLDVTVFREREADKRATGVSFGLRLPLWNANRGEVARAAAGEQVARAEADRARLEARAELQARLAELQVAADQASLLERDVLPAATRSVALVRLSFEEGETSLLELLDAQRTQREAQREAAQARLAETLALGEVQKLAGPDFEPWR